MNITEKLNNRMDKVNSLVCVGLDSELEKIPERFRGLENPQFEFNKWIIEETNEFTASYKMNIAFYEAEGDKGFRELKMTAEYLQSNYPDIYLICDSKRGDIGNTNNGYIKSLFDWFGFDAITLHPYFGKESLIPFFNRKDKGSIILCRSSNPGAGELQDLKIEGKMVWEILTEKVISEWNFNNNCLLMFGATYPEEMKKARGMAGDMTFLVPGLGAQGGDVEATVRAGLNSEKKGLILHSSRAIIFSDDPKKEAKKLRDEINRFRV